MEIVKGMTVGRLKQLLSKIPDSTIINILNAEGEWSSQIEFWYEETDTRRFVSLTGLKPMWKTNQEN